MERLSGQKNVKEIIPQSLLVCANAQIWWTNISRMCEGWLTVFQGHIDKGTVTFALVLGLISCILSCGLFL